MALAPVWASIWPIFTTTWAPAEVTASPSTASVKTALFTMTQRLGRVMTISFDLMGDSLSEKPLGDDLFHHLGRARGDGPEPHVAEEALHGKLAHVAVATVELDRLVGDPVGHLGAEELGHGDLGDAVPPGTVEPRRAASISVAISAIRCRRACLSLRGVPKAWRSWIYFWVSSSA